MHSFGIKTVTVSSVSSSHNNETDTFSYFDIKQHSFLSEFLPVSSVFEVTGPHVPRHSVYLSIASVLTHFPYTPPVNTTIPTVSVSFSETGLHDPEIF